MRSIGLDVHRDFCEVAIAEGGALRSAGRIETTPAALRLFAESLGSEDSVALEATTQAAQVARLIEPHVARVVIANTRKLAAITQAKAKTDRLDARTLARLLASGYLEQVWAPDEETRSLRRLVARRSRLVRARTRAKNEVHGVLARNLCPRPPVTDAFGKAGRRWLSTLVLPDDEQLTLEGCLRQIDFLDEEVGAIERKLAERALQSVDIRRLMTVPGVNVQTAAAFVASVGDIGRFSSPRKLVSYLGLDPRVRQSGSEVARHGHISKAGSAAPHARRGRLEGDDDSRPVAGLLRARPLAPRSSGRGHGDRAQARGLFWHLLTREEDYAFARPAMTRKKIRQLELLAGAPPRKGKAGGAGNFANRHVREAERELSGQAEAAYRRLVSDWRASGPKKKGAGATPGRASSRPSKRQAARQAQ
jgi:transposase